MEKNYALDEAIIAVKNGFVSNMKLYILRENPSYNDMIEYFYETEEFIKTLENLKDKEEE